jgi:Uma2 family endonuclease
MPIETLNKVDELEELEDEDLEEDMPTYEHGFICATVSRHVGNYVADNNLGRVSDASLEYRFLNTPEPAKKGKKPGRQPDVSFIAADRLPSNFREYADIAPDFAVEVTSPSDKEYQIDAKVKLYQQYGVKLIWIIHPYSRSVSVYRLATKLKQLNLVEGEELEGYDVIPGLKLPVSAIFDYPPAPDYEF